MFNLTLKNDNGDSLTFAEGGPFTVSEIDGLNPPDASINTSKAGLMDGEIFNGAKVEMRTINLAFAIEYNAAENRIAVYKVIKPKEKITMCYSSDTRDVFISGYVKSLNITFFEMKQIATVQIICPRPYFEDAQSMINELSSIVKMFHFPFFSTETPQIVFGYLDPVVNVEIRNDGDVETGLIFNLYAKAAISNPKIFDYVTGDFIGLNFSMKANDRIIIDTRKGQKSVTLIRDGKETNIFNSLMKGITWLTLPANGGVYTYEVGTGKAIDLSITISHYTLYEGV